MYAERGNSINNMYLERNMYRGDRYVIAQQNHQYQQPLYEYRHYNYNYNINQYNHSKNNFSNYKKPYCSSAYTDYPEKPIKMQREEIIIEHSQLVLNGNGATNENVGHHRSHHYTQVLPPQDNNDKNQGYSYEVNISEDRNSETDSEIELARNSETASEIELARNSETASEIELNHKSDYETESENETQNIKTNQPSQGIATSFKNVDTDVITENVAPFEKVSVDIRAKNVALTQKKIVKNVVPNRKIQAKSSSNKKITKAKRKKPKNAKKCPIVIKHRILQNNKFVLAGVEKTNDSGSDLLSDSETDTPLAVHTQFSTKTNANTTIVNDTSTDGNDRLHKLAEPSMSAKYTSTQNLSKNLPEVCSDESKGQKTNIIFRDDGLRAEEIITLQTEDRLTDGIIGSHFKYLQDVKFADNTSMLFVAPVFTQLLLSKDKNVKTDLKTMMAEKQFIFLPFSDVTVATYVADGGSHWTLMLLSIPQKKCFFFNSTNGDSSLYKNYCKTLKELLEIELDFVNCNCSKQTNGNDCGLYVLCNAENIAAQIYLTNEFNMQAPSLDEATIAAKRYEILMRLTKELSRIEYDAVHTEIDQHEVDIYGNFDSTTATATGSEVEENIDDTFNTNFANSKKKSSGSTIIPEKREAETKLKSGKIKKIFRSDSMDDYDSGSSLSELDLYIPLAVQCQVSSKENEQDADTDLCLYDNVNSDVENSHLQSSEPIPVLPNFSESASQNRFLKAPESISNAILAEIRIVKEQNLLNVKQNANIMSKVKRIRKDIAKFAKGIEENDREIREILPLRTCERFYTWDNRITQDKAFYNKMIIAALAVSLGPLAAGLGKGYSSPAIASLQELQIRHRGNYTFTVTDQQASWVASLSLLGALFGGMFGGVAMQYGRRRLLTIMSLPFSLSWILTVFAKSVETMFATAFLGGFCCAIVSMVTQVYISEISSPDIRGFLSAIQKIAGHLGILISFSLGAYLDWRQLAMLVSVAPMMLFVTVIYVPETPSFLVLKGRDEEAYRSLQWLRGPHKNVELELETIRSNIRASKNNAGRFSTITTNNFMTKASMETIYKNIKSILQNTRLLKPVLITCGLMVFQRFTGANSFGFYAVKIFRQTFAGINPHGGAVAVGFVQLLASMLSGLLIDTVGRIPLLIISSVFMSLALASFGSYVYYEQAHKLMVTNSFDLDTTSVNSDWIPLLCVLVFTIAFSLGISPISSLLVGELFPLEYRGIGSSIATSFSYFCAFLSVKTFVDFQESMGLHGAFWLYACISCVGLFFVVMFVPETKGKDLDEMDPKYVQTMTINR